MPWIILCPEQLQKNLLITLFNMEEAIWFRLCLGRMNISSLTLSLAFEGFGINNTMTRATAALRQ